MNMRMMLQPLIPGMEHGEETFPNGSPSVLSRLRLQPLADKLPAVEASRVVDSNGTHVVPHDPNPLNIHAVIYDPLMPYLARYLV